jgi:hypothetical protein
MVQHDGLGRGEAVDGLPSRRVRSVNHRFCELSARLPRLLASYEAEARRIVQERTNRGKISLVVTWGENGEDGREPTGTLTLDERAADRYAELLRRLQTKYHLSGDVDVKTFAALPGLFVWGEGSHPSSTGLWQVVTKATDDHIRMKETGRGAGRIRGESRASARAWARSASGAAQGARTAEVPRIRQLPRRGAPEERPHRKSRSSPTGSTRPSASASRHCDHFIKVLGEEATPAESSTSCCKR